MTSPAMLVLDFAVVQALIVTVTVLITARVVRRKH